MIGSMIAGVISVGSGIMANSIGVGGIPGFLSIQAGDWFMFFVAMAVAIVVPVILTMVFSKMKMGQNAFERLGKK